MCRCPRRAARRACLFLITPLTLLKKSTRQPSPPTGGDVLRAPVAWCCQHQNAPKIGKLAPRPFHSKFLLRNECFRTSVGLPYTTPHCLPPAPYEFLTADHILAPRPANTFCKINEKAEKTTAKKCRRPRRAARRPSLLLITPLSLLEKSTWQPSPPTGGDVLRAPAACCCQHQHVVTAATCLSPLLPPDYGYLPLPVVTYLWLLLPPLPV